MCINWHLSRFINVRMLIPHTNIYYNIWIHWLIISADASSNVLRNNWGEKLIHLLNKKSKASLLCSSLQLSFFLLLHSDIVMAGEDSASFVSSVYAGTNRENPCHNLVWMKCPTAATSLSFICRRYICCFILVRSLIISCEHISTFC